MAKILIVDDEAFNILLLSKRLTKLGYEISEAKNGFEALDLIGGKIFDLILLDIMMPDMDGFEVAKQIMSRPDYNHIPIIFLSARTSIESKLEGLALGAQDYITKPFDFRELEVRIKMILQKNQEKNKMLEESQKLREEADRDFLTGLFNRRYIDALLKKEVDNFAFTSLFMMDLDYFKRINDTYGHDQGDIVLKEVARIIKEAAGSSAAVGRYGGEEFIAVLHSVSEEAALSIAEQIRSRIEQHIFELKGQAVHITISIGVASVNKNEKKYPTVDAWIEASDTALYQAKNTGRNRVAFV